MRKELTVAPVQTKKELKQFILLPWKIYRNDKNWVPPLISERKDFLNPNKNPFFAHAEVKLFLAQKGGQITGRIAAIVNHLHIQTHNEKCGFFGLFECIENFEVTKALLDTAKTWLVSKGMEKMRGPGDFSSNDQWGFLLEGFDSPPTFMMPYNPKYYLEFMERYGLKKSKDLYAYYLSKDKKPPERTYKVAERTKQKENLVVRKINMGDFEAEVKKVKEIYNQAWSRNWGAIPMTDEEFSHMAKEMKQIMDKDLVFIAEVDGNPAGFSLAIPNVNEALIKLNGRLFPFGLFKLLYYAKKIKSLRMITMGVIHKYQKRGIDNIFYIQTFDEGTKKGYTWGELSWILEDNLLMNRAAELMNAKLYKKYRIYEGEVSDSGSDFPWLHGAMTSRKKPFFNFSHLLAILLFLLGITFAYSVLPQEKQDWIRGIDARERIIIEGNHSVKISNKKKASTYSHKLHDLGVKALQKGDFDAYQEAIWQSLRLYEFCITADWPNDPTTAQVRAEASDEIVSLITTNPLDWKHHFRECVSVREKLGDFALAGTKVTISDYNEGKFFSPIVFTEGLNIMRCVIDSLCMKAHYSYADLIFGVMKDVIFAEGHRRIDQGYRISPNIDDMPRKTLGGERIADEGQPRELDSFYKACYIMSRVNLRFFRSFVEKAEYCKLKINLLEAGENGRKNFASMDSLVNFWKYYHCYSISGYVRGAEEKQKVLDSLLSISNQNGEEAAECVKKLVWRERYLKEWRRKFSR